MGLRHLFGKNKTNQPLAWLALCVFFIISTIIAPVNALVVAVPSNLSIGTNSNDKQSNAHSSPTELKANQHHKVMARNSMHHVGMDDSPCQDPACDNMPQCTDDCSMSSCTSSSGNYLPLPPDLLITNAHDVIAHRFCRDQHLVVRTIDPLFRPPIH